MAVVNTSYLMYPSHPVLDKDDFFKSGIPEAPVLRKLDTIIKQILVVNDKQITLNILGENSGYRFDVLGSGSLKQDFTAQIYYVPKGKILDIYDHTTVGTGTPLVGFRNKKCMIRNFSVLLQTLHLEKLFNPLVSIL